VCGGQPLLRLTMSFAIAEKDITARENATEGGKQVFTWKINPVYGTFPDRIAAMRSYFGREAIGWSAEMVKRQFHAVQYNWKHAKIVRVE
jgi:hypothetical protein